MSGGIDICQKEQVVDRRNRCCQAKEQDDFRRRNRCCHEKESVVVQEKEQVVVQEKEQVMSGE